MLFSSRNQISLFLLSAFILFQNIDAYAQNRSGDQRSALESLIGRNAEHNIFVDEFGVRLIMDRLSQEGYIDPDTYILGSLDMLSIEVRSGTNLTMRGLTINPQGYLVIPQVGQIDLKNQTVTTAKELITERIRTVFTNAEVSVSIDRPKPVTVHLAGDIKNSGSIVLQGQTRADQAILMVLGSEIDELDTAEQTGEMPQTQLRPNLQQVRNALMGQVVSPFEQISREELAIEIRKLLEITPYSVRNITIRRNDGTEAEIDLMAYFFGGILDANPFLRDGDVIIFHKNRHLLPRVAVSGGVNLPVEMEYKAGDSVRDIVKIAGGLRADAIQDHATLYRIHDGRIESLQMRLNSDDDLQLQPNDRLIVQFDRNLQNQFASAWIYGEVDMPGNYPIIQGETKIADLLNMSGHTTDGALTHGAFLVRDRGYRNQDFRFDRFIDIPRIKRTSDQFLEGLEYLDFETNLSENRVYVDLGNQEMLESTMLFDGDRLYIPRDENVIFVFGQVNQSGYFQFDGRSNVNDYIGRAGGFALASDEKRVFIIKAGGKNWKRPGETTLESGDIIFVDREPYYDAVSTRLYEVQTKTQRNQSIQLILTGVTTLASVITTYIFVRNRR